MLAGTGVTIALGAGGLWFLTATTPGINALASFAGSMAKDTAGLEITADGLEGSLWGRISARRITLRGDDGLDLAIENALLDWTPSRLFEKTVGISELSASDVALTLPETAETTEDEESSATSIPALALNLEKLALPSISLRVTGRDTPYRFALNARASRTEAGISNLVAALETLDGSEDSLKLDATLDPASETLALDSVLHVSTDGPIAALAGLTGSLSAPIDLEIAGNGPLQTWQGKLRSKYGTLLHWEAGIGAALTEAPVLAIDGIAEVRDPAAFAMPPVLGGGYRHALEIRRDGDGRITVQNIDITLADRFSAAGSLAYEPENNAIGGNLDIRAMEGLSAIADGAVSWQEVFATIGISGTADKPAAEIAANITGFDVPDILKADLALDGQLSSIADGGYRLALTSDIHPESLPDPALAPLAGERVHVELDAATAKDFSTFTIARLDLKGAAVTVNGKGSVAASGALDALAARVSLSDLAALKPLTGMDMAGRADLVIGSLTGAPGESMASDVTLTISDLATGVSDLDRLLGRQASIRGRLELQGTESVSLQSLNFASAGLTVKGSAGYGITGGELTAKLDGNIARSALPDIPDLQFNGDPAFNVTLTGPATAPGGAITVTLDGLTAAGYRLTAIDLRAKPGWTEGDSTTDLTLRAKLNGQALALSSRIRTRTDRLDIAAIKGSLGDLALSGELTLPDYGPLLQGRVGIDPGKGNTVAALAGTPVSLDGGMIDVTFTPDGNRQSITASSRLNGVTVRDDANAVIAAIRETRLDAEISDAFGDLRFTASAGAEQLAAAGNRIDDLKAKARGTLTGIDSTSPPAVPSTERRQVSRRRVNSPWTASASPSQSIRARPATAR
jgi:translocation and assembly module TamB